MRRLAPLLLAGLILAGCGDDGGGGSPGESSSAFTAEAPDGYHLLAEGTGDQELFWGDDSLGNTGGFVVLGHSTDTDDPDSLTLVELTGFQGYQGGLEQAAIGAGEELEVDGQQALLSTAGDISQVLLVRGPDLAVGIQSTDLEDDELIDLARSTGIPEGNPPTEPPIVTPPEGFQVVGEGDADVDLALFAWANDGYLGAPPRAHGLAWEGRGGDDHLIVLTLPSAAGDPAAAFGYGRAYRPISDAERFEIDGREAVWVQAEDRNILTTTTEWGDLLVVVSSIAGVDAQLLDRVTLTAVAESVERD